MEVFRIEELLSHLQRLTQEIRFLDVVSRPTFKAGLIAFSPGGTADPRQITHPDKDVLGYVLRGRGRLRADGVLTPLEPGMLCHVPAKTPHDFAATEEEMLLLYVLIETPLAE